MKWRRDNDKRLQISEMTREKRKERSEGVQIKPQKVYNHTPTKYKYTWHQILQKFSSTRVYYIFSNTIHFYHTDTKLIA